MAQGLGNLWKHCSLIMVWFFWEGFGLWTWQLLVEKAYLSSLGSRISSGKVCCNCDPENKPTKVNWALSWPSALEICGKMLFNKGLISSLILLEKVWTLNLAVACGKGLPFFSWLQDQLWKSSLQLWTLRTNLLKWIGPSHGPVPWKFVEKVFFNKGSSSLILLGQGEKRDFFRKNVRSFLHIHFFGQKHMHPKISCHNSEPSKQCRGSE